MNPKKKLHFTVLICLLILGLSSTIIAAEQSGCITCHLDEALIIQNLSGVKVKTSTMQSGSG